MRHQTVRQPRLRDVGVVVVVAALLHHTESSVDFPVLRLLREQRLRLAEWARHQEDVLVDLSFTLTQFAHTSVAVDMCGAARRFEKRMTLGSDSLHEDLDRWVSERDNFLQDIPDESRSAISSENILNFLRGL